MARLLPILVSLAAGSVLALQTAIASDNLTLSLADVTPTTTAPAPLSDIQGTPRDTDYATKLTIYWENDGGFAKPNSRTDRHYTAGVGASLSMQAPFITSVLFLAPTINNEFDPAHTDYAAGFVGSLSIFTPNDLINPNPITNDRPYAGWTYGGLYAQRANRAAAVPAYESLEFDLGILGPSSLAENAQQMIHHYYGYIPPQGWNNQINDEPEFSIKYNRRWRFPLWESLHEQYHYAPTFQALPEVGFTAGTLQDEVHGGALFRLGWNIPDDFGPGYLARPADFTGPTACACGTTLSSLFRSGSFYFYARPYGELVAHDATLSGDNFSNRDSVTVNPEPAIFGFEYGLSWRFLKFFEFTYSQTYDSPTFQGQHAWDSFASLQLSFVIAF